VECSQITLHVRSLNSLVMGIKNLILKTVGWKCWCKTTTRVFKDDEGYYIRCLECGRRVAYDWAELGSFHRSLKASHHSYQLPA
jgi:Zn finger protein HypA/HybF involved in hydrogenase expression